MPRKMEGFEDFTDVTEQNPGIFAGGGLDELERQDWKPVSAGIQFDFCCHNCGRPLALLVEWEELLALKYGLTPAVAYQLNPGKLKNPIKWVADRKQGGWVPDVVCQRCDEQERIPLLIGFTEPEKYLRAGRGRFISPAGEKDAVQEINKVRQMMNQQRRQRGLR